jgi:xylan 1,4-beta-xylosidase
MKYKNPIIPGFHPDPSICKAGEDYYLVTSSFEYFPGVPVFHSRDLINWEQIGYCLTSTSQLPLNKANPSAGIYAPTIRFHNGTFYMVTTNVSYGGNFYVTATDPAGEWSEPIWVEQGGIDPSLFFDDDGKVYFTSNAGENGREGITQAEIDIGTGRLLSPIRFIWEGTGGRYPEAPHIYKINDTYFLMLAEGGTEYGHMVTISRSSSPWGPFLPCPHNPILTHRNRGGHIVQGTGHGDLIQAHNGSWWLVFLAFRNAIPLFHHLGRETFIAPVLWDKNGWPVVNHNDTVELEMESECLQQHPFAGACERDDFELPELNLCWNFLRNPYPDIWSLSARHGWLCLYGSEITLDDIDSPALICRRQQHFDCSVSTLVEFNPSREREEAGLTVFCNNEHHYEIAITLIKGKRKIIVRRRVGDLSAVVAMEKIENKPVILEIKADRYRYTFSYGYCKSSMKTLSEGGTQYVSAEVTRGCFTGVYLGIYATGNGASCKGPAFFDWFDYKEL